MSLADESTPQKGSLGPVRTGPTAEQKAEIIRTMASRGTIAKHVANSIYEKVEEFVRNLSEDEEAAAVTSFASNQFIHLREVGYEGSGLVVISGVTEDGEEVKLVQHPTQVSVLLQAVEPIGDEPQREIGFRPSDENRDEHEGGKELEEPET